MAGRKPKPTAVKKLEGNPGKRKLNTKEPVPEKGMGLFKKNSWCRHMIKKTRNQLSNQVVLNLTHRSTE